MSAARVAAVAGDHRSGASGLALRAGDEILAAIRAGPDGPKLAELAIALVRAQPAIAPVARLASSALRAFETGGPERARRAVAGARTGVATSARRLVAVSADHVAPGVRLLTHSSSSAVCSTLKAAHDRGLLFSVICLEARPLREGADLARDLARIGIPTTVMVDAAMSLAVGEVDVVLLGADTLAPRGLVHKVGTWPLCLAASELGVPVYVVATSDKLLPGVTRGALESERAPDEVWRVDQAGLTIANRAFDITPLDLIDGIFVGGDLLDPEELAARARRVSLHPAIRAELDG